MSDSRDTEILFSPLYHPEPEWVRLPRRVGGGAREEKSGYYGFYLKRSSHTQVLNAHSSANGNMLCVCGIFERWGLAGRHTLLGIALESNSQSLVLPCCLLPGLLPCEQPLPSALVSMASLP